MTTDDKPGAERKKPKLFKSRKELVVLAVSATVFAFVIYKMYLSKGRKAMQGPAAPAAAQPAQPAPAAPAPAPAAGAPPAAAPSPAPTPDLEALLADCEADDQADHRAPDTLPRDPFTMSDKMREQVFDAHVKNKVPAKKAPDLVTLTPANAKHVLAAIPGAEKAAAEGLKLEAVMQTGSWRAAVINGKVVELGGTILGFTLADVKTGEALLHLGEHRVRLLMGSASAPDADARDKPSVRREEK